MDITQTKSEGLIREFDILVSPIDIEKNMTQKLNQVGQTAKIPGFRPGKIPLSVLKQHYESRIRHEVFEKILQDAKNQLIDQHDFRVALEPHMNVDFEHFNPTETLKIQVSLEILPDIDKIDLKKFSFEQLIAEVQDDEILQALETVRQRTAQFEEAPAGTAAQKNDTVHIAFKGTLASGKPIVGGASEGMDLELGSGSFIPGFEDQLMGLKEGDHKEFDIVFPTDYQAKDLAGQQTHFVVNVKKVKQKALPELGDDFAKQVGRESLDDLKKAMSDLLANDYQSMSLLDAKRKILDQFAEDFSFSVPQNLKKLEYQSILNQLMQEKQKSNTQQETSASDNTDNASNDLSPEDQEQYQNIAERRVRLGLILAEIGRDHNIVVSQKELEQALIQEVKKYPSMEQKVIDYYHHNPNAQASLRAPIFENKVIELILKEANTTQVKVSYADLKKRIQEITDETEENEQ